MLKATATEVPTIKSAKICTSNRSKDNTQEPNQLSFYLTAGIKPTKPFAYHKLKSSQDAILYTMNCESSQILTDQLYRVEQCSGREKSPQ